ncbi:RNA polymerase sigma factor [Microbispora sp. NPDC049125]|uniref:RNA polymerase sigma factor n=1 Tax=Microbispora sp. NPDC049125 TaxID=3154929 RepID=UPI003464FC28
MARSLALHLARDAGSAEDLAQEGFLQAWTSLGRLKDGERFRSRLYGIPLNLSRRCGRVARHVSLRRQAALASRTPPAPGRLADDFP